MKNKFLLYALLTSICAVPGIAQISVDGDLSDPDYISIGTKLNANGGFGPDINVQEISYYPDDVAGILYIGIEGKLNTGSNDGLGVLLNVSGSGSPSGSTAGSNLAFGGGGHFLDQSYFADFEADFGFAFNPGFSASDVYWDAVKFAGGGAEYQGNCNQSGATSTNGAAGGSVFSNSSVSFAFNNGGGGNQGLEMAIPYAELGATSAMDIEVFAFIVSESAYFSDVTVPGNIDFGNPGFGPDFGVYGGAPYHTIAAPLSLFTCETPANLTVSDLTSSSVTLSWDAVAGSTGYVFQFQNNATGVNKRIKLSAATTTISLGPSQISAGGSYSWGVRTRCDGENSPWSPANTFSAPLRLAGVSEPLASVFPNPSQGSFQVFLPEWEGALVDIQIVNVTGQMLQSIQAYGGTLVPIHLTDPGVYIIFGQSGSQSFSERVIVQ